MGLAYGLTSAADSTVHAFWTQCVPLAVLKSGLGMANVMKLAATLQYASTMQETVTQHLHQQHQHLQVRRAVQRIDPAILTATVTP